MNILSQMWLLYAYKLPKIHAVQRCLTSFAKEYSDISQKNKKKRIFKDKKISIVFKLHHHEVYNNINATNFQKTLVIKQILFFQH